MRFGYKETYTSRKRQLRGRKLVALSHFKSHESPNNANQHLAESAFDGERFANSGRMLLIDIRAPFLQGRPSYRS
jgi:hypothetical protein